MKLRFGIRPLLSVLLCAIYLCAILCLSNASSSNSDALDALNSGTLSSVTINAATGTRTVSDQNADDSDNDDTAAAASTNENIVINILLTPLMGRTVEQEEAIVKKIKEDVADPTADLGSHLEHQDTLEARSVGSSTDVIQITVDARESDENVKLFLEELSQAVDNAALIEKNEPVETFNHLSRGIIQLGALEVADYEFDSPDCSPLPAWKHNLLGTGQIIGFADSGIDMNHCFFRQDGQDPRQPFVDTPGFEPSVPLNNLGFRKVVQYVTYGDDIDMHGHGTHVGGTIAGELDASAYSGPNSLYAGMAPQAKLAHFDMGPGFGFSAPPDLRDMFSFAYASGARLHSNSWGSSFANGQYNIFSFHSDIFMYEHRDFLAIFAAGNSGGCGNSTTVSAPATAKSVLAVGSSTSGLTGAPDEAITDDTRDTIAFFSSQGPTQDGRIKPDVIAPGFFTFSAAANRFDTCSLRGSAGTSMATPTVAGIAALVREYLTSGFYPSGQRVERDGFNPSGSLMKALLIAGAEPMRFRQEDFSPFGGSFEDQFHTKCTTSGLLPRGSQPDNEQGWGRVQLDTTLSFEPHRLLILSHDPTSAPHLFNDVVMPRTETNHIYCASVTRDVLDVGSDSTVRIVLAWTDIPAPFLANDLHLRVLPGTTGVWQYGNTDDPTAPADNVNPVESVRLSMPETPGVTDLQILIENGHLYEDQPYSLVALVDDEKLEIVQTTC